MLVRNMSRSRNKDPQKNLLTSVGDGAAQGSVMVFEPDLDYMRLETISERPQVLPPGPAGSRYILIHHDVVADEVVYDNRENVALFFSRTGGDDFVAGAGVTPRGEIASYAQGVRFDDSLYISYTHGRVYRPRSIRVARVTPLPAADGFYIFPRRKDMLDMERRPPPVHWERHNPDYVYHVPRVVESEAGPRLRFSERGTAGVETDPVDLSNGDRLEVELTFAIRRMPYRGNLVLCTFGDRIPVRIGIPSNRPEQLYVQCAEGWRPAFDMDGAVSGRLDLEFGGDSFRVSLNDNTAKSFPNPSPEMAPRLYLGDGYETDFTESNRGAVFDVDLSSFRTRVVHQRDEESAEATGAEGIE
jgi:hypothetical protein